MTEPQVIARLEEEIRASSLTIVASIYSINLRQLSDIIHGRANLSKKVLSKIKLRMHRFYEKVR